MLAATSRRDSPIWLFETVLRSLDGKPEVSPSLRGHALDVLHVACDIAANPSMIGPKTLPESIELAQRLRENSQLRLRLQEFRALDAIPAGVARQLLTAFAPIAA